MHRVRANRNRILGGGKYFSTAERLVQGRIQAQRLTEVRRAVIAASAVSAHQLSKHSFYSTSRHDYRETIEEGVTGDRRRKPYEKIDYSVKWEPLTPQMRKLTQPSALLKATVTPVFKSWSANQPSIVQQARFASTAANQTEENKKSLFVKNPNIYQKHFFEYSSMALLVSLPVPLLVSLPTPLVFGLDMVTAFALPLHTYLGMKLVIDDYLPQASVNAPSTFLLLLLVAAIAGGLVNINTSGEGVSATVKRLWVSNEDK